MITSLIVALGLTFFPGLAWAEQTPQPISSSVTRGRFQVVNGAPEFRGMVMLLDTLTGDVWITCDLDGGVSGWCKMPKSNSGAVQKKNDPLGIR